MGNVSLTAEEKQLERILRDAAARAYKLGAVFVCVAAMPKGESYTTRLCSNCKNRETTLLLLDVGKIEFGASDAFELPSIKSELVN